MKLSKGKIISFVIGAAVGSVVSAFVTRNVVDKVYREVADEEIYKAWKDSREQMKGYKDKIQELEEKIKQQSVTIQTLADQVRRTGGTPVEEDDIPDDSEDDPGQTVPESNRESARENYRSYARRYTNGEDEYVFDEEDNDPEVEEQIIDKRGAAVISEESFANDCMDYSKEDLHYFMYDGKVISEDGEYLDNYAWLIGEDWKLHGKNAGDEVYVRNDRMRGDYRIIFTAGAGEDAINYSLDDWG